MDGSEPKQIGRYEVRGNVGGGGMGDVYRVHDPMSGREVALKVLKFSYPRALHYFKREFRAVARLAHPNLVKLYDLHQNEGTYFYTMELIDGVDLYVYVNGHDRLVSDVHVLCETARVARIRSATVQLLRALAFLHDSGCIHRDIKPSNILVDTNGRVRLVDFGIVKETLPGGEGQSLSQVFGTSTYFSPEQSLGSRVTAATDNYAVGVVLYELLAGSPPFEGEGPEVAVAHRTLQPPSLVQRVPGVAPDLALVCMELLSKDPASRPSAREALEMLDAQVEETEPSLDFVGRRGARRVLHSALDEVRRGEGRIVLVEGPLGSGKSALVSAFGQEARLFGASTFEGACVPRDHVDYRGLDTLVERLAEAYRKQTARILRKMPSAERGSLIGSFSFLGELLPEKEHGESDGRSAGLGLSALLHALAKDRLLILCVDQIHLADAATLDAIESLPHVPPVLLVLTLRSDAIEPNSRLAAFHEVVSAHPSSLTVELGEFGVEETRQLLEDQVNDPPGWLVEHVYTETGGAPLLVADMVREVAKDPIAPPPTLDEMLARRLDAVGQDGREVLEVLAVSPRAVPGPVLERACGVDTEALFDAVAQLEEEDLASADAMHDGTVVVAARHPSLLEVARRALDFEQLESLHESLARAWQAKQGSAADVRYHWEAAGKPERAMRYAARVAVEARKEGDFERAAESLELLLGQERPPEERVELLVGLAEALALSGRYLQAAKTLEEVAPLSPEAGERWHVRKCHLYLMAGDLAAFARNAEVVPGPARVPLADLLAPLDPARAEILLGESDTVPGQLVRARIFSGKHSPRAIAEAGHLVRATAAEAGQAEPKRRAAHAVAQIAVLRARGDFEAARRVVHSVREALSDTLPEHDLQALRLLLAEAELSLEMGRVAEARRMGRHLLAVSRANGLVGLQMRACILQAWILLEGGSFAAAGRLLDEAGRLAEGAPASVPKVHLRLARARKLFYSGSYMPATESLHELKYDEGLRPCLARRQPAGTFALMYARLCAARAARAWQQGDDGGERGRLSKAIHSLERALPRPDSWLQSLLAILDLVGDMPERTLHRLESALLKPSVPVGHPQIEALMWATMGSARERLGHDGDEGRRRASELLRESGAAPLTEMGELRRPG